MIVDHCTRWNARCCRFITPRGAFDARRYEVAEIADDTTARTFVTEHHYSGTYVAAWRRFGLFERGELVGVCVYSVPSRPEVLRPFPTNAAAELGRLVLLDRVPFNAETFLVSRAADALRGDGVGGFVMFSDPFARETADGRRVFAGHRGIVYQALRACFLGQSHADTVHLLPDGRLFARRAISKIRLREQGWRYAVEALVTAGARPPFHTGTAAALAEWLDAELPRVARKIRHPGNFKYAFALSAAAANDLPASLPYPRLPRPTCVAFDRRAA